ncbi:MAG: cytochrome P460 family protein [SAR324 cluster bacterium]|nr:cytochrome P460 family protein [SAR324 cluster bacterium]
MWSQGKSNIQKRLPALAASAFISAALLLGGYQLLPMTPELKAASHGEDSAASESETPASKPPSPDAPAVKKAGGMAEKAMEPDKGAPPDAPSVKKADGMAEPAMQPGKTGKPWWKKGRRQAVSSEPPQAEPKPEAEKTEPLLAAETKTETGPEPPPAERTGEPPAASSRKDADAEPPPAKKVDFIPPPPKKMEWGTGYKSWPAVSGFVSTRFHGGRIVQTYIFPMEAVKIFNENAKNARMRKKEGFRRFPPGTIIAQKTWARNTLGGPGEEGPMFLMRKEPRGYDTDNGDWQYVLASKDFNIIGEGRSAQVVPCKQCHGSVKNRDYVFASEF